MGHLWPLTESPSSSKSGGFTSLEESRSRACVCEVQFEVMRSREVLKNDIRMNIHHHTFMEHRQRAVLYLVHGLDLGGWRLISEVRIE